MGANTQISSERDGLVVELYNLRNRLSDIFIQKELSASEYIDLLKIESLLKKYHEETLLYLIRMKKEELTNIYKQKGFGHSKTIQISQELDELIIRYQKLKTT